MARGKKTGGRDFVKGHSVGRPKMNPNVRHIKRLTQESFASEANRLLFATRSELKDIIDDPKSTALTIMIGKTIKEAFRLGDVARLSVILDRLIGRPANPISLDAYISKLDKLSDTEIIEKGREAIAYLEREGSTATL